MEGSTFTFSAPRIDVLAASIRRFPIAMLAAITFATISSLAEIHKVIKLPFQDIILFGCFASFFALLATELVAEARRWPFAKRLLACAMSAAAVAGWCAMAGAEMGMPHWLFGFAVFGFCIAAPAFGGAGNEELWQFNQQTFLGLGIAGVATGIMLAGAGAVLYAMSTLFGFGDDGKWFATCAVIACALFWPTYTMTFMPRLPIQLNAPPMMPGPLAFVLTFIALPVLLLFGAIIAAYGISVLGLGSTPAGSVGWMVMGFSACGIALHFLLFPMRSSGNVLVRWFQRFFFILLIPMLGLLFWAVILRVSEYGITENRYMALLGGFWAVSIALAAVLRRGELGLGNAPAALALLLVIASLGPWSAESVSYRSQEIRLRSMLASLNILQNGEIREPVARVEASWEQRGNLSSLLDYFRSRRDDRLPEYLQPYSSIDLMHTNGWSDAVMRRWQMRYVDPWERSKPVEMQHSDRISFYADEALFSGQRNPPVSISGYDWLLQFHTATQLLSDDTRSLYGRLDLGFSIQDNRLMVRSGIAEAFVDVMALLPQPLDEQASSISRPMLTQGVELANTRLLLMITNMDIERRSGGWQLNSVNGYVLVKAEGQPAPQ